MKAIKVFYQQFENHLPNNYEDVFKFCLSMPNVGLEPTTVFENTDKNSIYYRCPAWAHKAKRTFIIKSPIDVSITVDKENQALWVNDINQEQFDKWFFLEDGWCSKKKVTIQIFIPHFIFWTNHKNIWIEQKPYFETAVKNNFIAVGGWFNLSSWTRGLSFAFDVVDPLEKIVIKRGDPLYTVSFYSKNLNDNFKLIKEDIDFQTFNKIHQNISVKSVIEYLSSKLIFKEEKSKCPFAFLWKNTPQDKG